MPRMTAIGRKQVFCHFSLSSFEVRFFAAVLTSTTLYDVTIKYCLIPAVPIFHLIKEEFNLG